MPLPLKVGTQREWPRESPPWAGGQLPTWYRWVPVPPSIAQHLLAEVEEQLLEDEDGAGAAEDDEWLPGEEAKHGACHRRAKEALHDALGIDQTQHYSDALPRYIPTDTLDGDGNAGPLLGPI